MRRRHHYADDGYTSVRTYARLRVRNRVRFIFRSLAFFFFFLNFISFSLLSASLFFSVATFKSLKILNFLVENPRTQIWVSK